MRKLDATVYDLRMMSVISLRKSSMFTGHENAIIRETLYLQSSIYTANQNDILETFSDHLIEDGHITKQVALS